MKMLSPYPHLLKPIKVGKFILKNRITHPEQLKEFEWEGFSYCKTSSNKNTFRFILK